MTDLTGRQILDAIKRGLEESGRRFETADPNRASKPQPDGCAARILPEKQSRPARRA